MLERQAVDERFGSDVLLGDLTFQTAYGLPGERRQSQVRADLLLSWPTWSQSAYRDWYMGDGFTESPVIQLAVTLRVQGLEAAPDLPRVLAVLPLEGPKVGVNQMYRGGPTVEREYSHDLTTSETSVEVLYAGPYELSEEILADGTRMDADVSALGGWVASTLVKLGDLKLQ